MTDHPDIHIRHPDLFQIEIVEGVKPLDSQFGQTDRKAVPDLLRDPLFGQPDPLPSEIEAAGGDPAKVPAMQTFAILDAAKVANLPALLDASGLEHRCLFKGGTAEELAEVAPWLVRLTEDSRLTRLLFTGKDAIGGLWQSEPGIYIRSRASFEDIWRHFRRFTRVQDECGNWFLFRFWEPRWLEANAAVLGGGSEAAIPSRWPPVRIVQPYPRR
ncbi:DUF4123 domain-containing protein [Paracoccus siganidrum]|nr:DUF4123 domain-containing protein [Paracoccus siganidrum]